MKFKKYIAMMLLAVATNSTFTACSDDEALEEAPRLFRPVASLEVQNNNIVATWDNIKGADNYSLELYRVIDTDATTGENTYELYETASCESSPYTFYNLNWDEKYMLKISCKGGTLASLAYDTDDINVNYISKLKSMKLIDNAARITWEEGGSVIKFIKFVPQVAGMEPVMKEVSEKEYENGTVDVVGLTPETPYIMYAYSSVEEQSNATYAGRISGTTPAAIDFDTAYGAGMWLDIRSYDEKQVVDTLKTSEFWEQVEDGMTIILRGDFDYKVNGDVKFDRSVRFVTASTLGGNARFISSGGMQCAMDATVEQVMFQNVDIISDKAIPGGDNEIAINTNKNFGSRQVFNENGTNSTLKRLIFKGCNIEGYRAIVRAQTDNDNIHEIVFDDCTINGVGDQGVVTTNYKKGDWKNITFKDCTITNIVMLCDLRSSAGELAMNINNCTFCYAPMETNANANTPLFRFGSNPVVLNISKTLFGPSMASDGGKGSSVLTYTPGTTAGSIFVNGSTALISVANSFKTNFSWTDLNGTTYPLEGLNELSFDETTLWTDPSKGEFKIKTGVGEEGIGASKWLN